MKTIIAIDNSLQISYLAKIWFSGYTPKCVLANQIVGFFEMSLEKPGGWI